MLTPAFGCVLFSLTHHKEEGGFPGGLSSKESTCQCGGSRFDPWVRKIPWRRKWQPNPESLPGESHWRGAWRGRSPQGFKRVKTRLSKQTRRREEGVRFSVTKAAMGLFLLACPLIPDSSSAFRKPLSLRPWPPPHCKVWGGPSPQAPIADWKHLLAWPGRRLGVARAASWAWEPAPVAPSLLSCLVILSREDSFSVFSLALSVFLTLLRLCSEYDCCHPD